MAISLAFLKDQEQFVMKVFDGDSVTEAFHPLSELSKTNLQLLCGSSDEWSVDILKDQNKFCVTCEVDQSEFESWNSISGKTYFKKALSKWLLLNNINSIEEIFTLGSYLKDLYRNDRMNFYEELWFIMRNNLGAQSLKMYYHNANQNEEKPKLIFSVLEGEKTPEFRDIGAEEKKFLKTFEKEEYPRFEVMEYLPEAEELTFMASIDQGPIFVMVKVYQLNKLQLAFFRALFEGLQDPPED